MRLDEKARENLEATARLLPDESGIEDPLSNAAASRAYYAAYHAVAHLAQRLRFTFTSERSYYRHDTLPDDALHWGILQADRCDDLRWLRDLRIKADYYEDEVSLEEASEAFSVASDLIEELLAEDN